MAIGSEGGGRVRQEIQALRALGVAVVVVAHYWPGLIPGGFIFIDGFFVASGFLITGILVREIEKRGRLSAPNFWVRRARRLLPAALVVLLFSSIVTLLAVPLNLWNQFFTEIQASALYVENIFLAHQAVDYFAANSQPSPTQHYWTLSFEEQFYLFFPLLLLLVLAIARRVKKITTKQMIAGLLLVVTLASLLYSIWQSRTNPEAAYFATLSRIWEISAGGLLALAGTGKGRPNLRAALSWLGVGCLFVFAFIYNSQTPYPGLAALVPVAASLAIIWSGMPRVWWSPSGWMRLRPLQWTGDASYSIYLWHWPFLILAPFVLDRQLTTASKIGLIALTLIVSAISKHYLEDRCRQGPPFDNRRPRTIFLFSALGVAAVLATTFLGLKIVDNKQEESRAATAQLLASKPACLGAASRAPRPCVDRRLRFAAVPSPEEIRSQTLTQQLRQWSDNNCRGGLLSQGNLRSICLMGVGADRARENIALIGDSHAEHWQPAFADAALAGRWQVASITRRGCQFEQADRFDKSRLGSGGCAAWVDAVVSWLRAHPQFNTVFVAQGAPYYQSAGIYRQQIKRLRAAWRRLPSSVKRIVILRDIPRAANSFVGGKNLEPENPRYSNNALNCIEKTLNQGLPTVNACRSRRLVVLDNFPDPAVTAAGLEDRARFSVFDFTPFFCDRLFCYPVVGGVVVNVDSSHMTSLFSKTLSPYLSDKVRRLSTKEQTGQGG